MRVLVATTANDGHFGPLLPIARACRARGHEVRVAAPESYAGPVARAGFAHAPFPDAPAELIGPVMGRLPSLSFEEADATVLREVFARIDAQAALPALSASFEAWRPDVVVREPAELGSLAAAERAGVPHVQVAIGMQETVRTFMDATAEPLDELGAMAGLSPGQLQSGWLRELTLSGVPERLDRAGDPGFREEWPTLRVRSSSGVDQDSSHAVSRSGSGSLPPWGDPLLPLVYVTFGSVTGSLPPFAGLFREALDALEARPVRVVMTVGRTFDLGRLGTLPTGARVVPWWPQVELLANAAVVLGHGGFGTTTGALAAGVPQVVAPVFSSDQVVNGRHVDAIGAGRTVEPGPGLIPRAVDELSVVLDDPSYRTRAAEVAGELAALPGPEAAALELERLAGTAVG